MRLASILRAGGNNKALCFGYEVQDYLSYNPLLLLAFDMYGWLKRRFSITAICTRKKE
jgi:hypothetical protein